MLYKLEKYKNHEFYLVCHKIKTFEVCLAFVLFVIVSLPLSFFIYKNYPLINSFYFYSTLSFSWEGEWIKSDAKLFGIGISISINTVGRERVSVLLKQS